MWQGLFEMPEDRTENKRWFMISMVHFFFFNSNMERLQYAGYLLRLITAASLDPVL